MQRPLYVRFGILFASVFLAFSGACTKQEARKDNGGGEQPDEPSDQPTDISPCLRMKLVQDDEEEGDEEASEEGDEEKKDDEEKEKDGDDPEDEDGIGSTSSSSGCDDEPEDPTPPSPSPGGLSGSWNPGPGLDGCEEKNQAWIAVKNGGPAECGANLVKWCCSAAEIANRFPGVASKLTPKIDDIVSGGLKLYHCSEDGGKTTFHFASGKGGSIQYKTLYVSSTNSKEGDTKGDDCPAVTMEDMGFTKSGTNDGGTTADIPKTIGELDDTSKSGLLDFLKAGEYKAWTGDTAVRSNAGPHGKVKIFFNTKLKNGLAADKTEQDVGSIAVKEIYKADGTTLDGYSIMAKHKAGDSKDTWFFYEVLGGSPDFKDQKAYAVGGPALCADCHKSGKDYIKSKPQP